MRHRIKQVFRVILIISTALGMFPCYPSVSAAGLSDVAGHWAEPYITRMVGMELISGYPDGRFGPDDPITREQFATILCKAAKLPDPKGPPAFSDVPTDRWSYRYVQSAVEAGIIHPEDYDFKFNPDEPITRIEIVVMLVRAAGLEKETAKRAQLTIFKDPIPDWGRGYVTVAVNHGLVTGRPDGTFGAYSSTTRAEASVIVLRMLDPKVRPAYWYEEYKYQAESGMNTLRVVRINFNRDEIEIRPALAGTVRDVAPLREIAEKSGAVAAINGTYFSCYPDKNPPDLWEPYNTLMIDGEWIHFTYQGTTLGITRDKQILMAPIRMHIDGYNYGVYWEAWSMNHTSPNIIGIFNKYRGATTAMTDGITFTVKDGRIVSRGGPDVPIPEDGYVIFVSNSCINEWTDRMFYVGGRPEYVVNLRTHDDKPYPPEEAAKWKNVVHAIGAGPRLVTNGRVSVNPLRENITEDKQTILAANRGAVGVTQDNIVMFVLCTRMTPQEFGEAMLDLGSYNAMQMDSGGSSGLYFQGKYIVQPGRNVSNALVVIEKK